MLTGDPRSLVVHLAGEIIGELVGEKGVLKSFRVFVGEIAVKIPSQKTHLGNLTCNFPEKYSIQTIVFLADPTRVYLTIFAVISPLSV